MSPSSLGWYNNLNAQRHIIILDPIQNNKSIILRIII